MRDRDREHRSETDPTDAAAPPGRCQICGAPHAAAESILCAACGEPVLLWGWA
jgi:hypothetical protein